MSAIGKGQRASGADARDFMTLREVVEQLDRLDSDQTIYAAGGGDAGPESAALVAMSPEDGALPDAAKGLAYLLEVDEAREVVKVWRSWRDGAEPNTEQKVQAITHYAKHDAYLPV